METPLWKDSFVDSENPSRGEGEDVKLCAWTSK